MRTRLIWHPDRKDWVDPSERKVRNIVFGRAPMYISGHLDYVMNHADGKIYTDKAAYYRAVRAAGCEVIGDEKMPEPQAPATVPNVEQDIADAMTQLGM